MFKNKLSIAAITATLLTAPFIANADTVTDTAINISKEGLNTAGNIFAYSVKVTPASINVGSSYTAILGAVGNIAQTLTSIAVDATNNARCKSKTKSFDDSQNVCESAPDFQEKKFCVVNMDNINAEDIRMELVNWNKTGHLGSVVSVKNVAHEKQLCIDRPLSATYLEVYDSSNKKIFSRPLPINLFNGHYGGLVKNGAFYLKEKQNELHYIMGYHLCPDIMYNSPGFQSQDVLARRCLARIKEQNQYQDNGQYDKLFTKTMKESNFDSLVHALPGAFNDEYIMKYSGIDMDSNEYSASIGGLFALTKDTYVYIDPKTSSAQKVGPDKIKMWNNFVYTGHTVSSENISGMTSSIPQSLLKEKINIFNGL